MLAARAARLFFTIQPIKFLIGGVVMADDVSMLTLPNLAAMTSFPTTEVTEFLRLGTNQNNIAQTLKKKIGKSRKIAVHLFVNSLHSAEFCYPLQ